LDCKEESIAKKWIMILLMEILLIELGEARQMGDAGCTKGYACLTASEPLGYVGKGF